MADFLIDEGKNKIEGLKKTEINQALESKADAQAVANAFESVNEALNGKASTQALNQAVQDINTALNGKANANDVYTKEQTYSKQQIDENITDIATPIVSELVPQIVGQDYYTKVQSNNAIFVRMNDLATNKSVFPFVLGSVTSTGSLSDSTTTVRTGFVQLKKGVNCMVDPDYMYRLYRYTQPNTNAFAEFYGYSYSDLHWIIGTFEVPMTDYYIVVCRKRDNSTIPSGDVQTVGEKVLISENLSLIELKNNISQNIFDYNKRALDEYIINISQIKGDLIIPIVTDIHGGYPDTFDVLNYLALSGIGNYFFELGDVIKSTYPTRNEAAEYLRWAFAKMDYANSDTEFVYLQGNHDTNPLAGIETSKNITQEMFYNLSKARTKHFDQPINKAYGFIDVEKAKVRIIYLNTSDIYSEITGDALVSGKKTMIQQTQVDWLVDHALNFEDKTTPSEWSILIFTHDSLSQVAGGMFGDILNAFKTGGTVSGTYPLTVDSYSYCISVHCDFSNQGALTVICEVNGHHHKDMIRELSGTGIKQVYVACEGDASACYDDNGTTVYYNRVLGTTDEHLIDTLILDKTNRKVYFKRFGVGSDREISY